MYYPMMINLADQKISIIGGGRIAYRKLKDFLAFGAVVTVISEQFIEDFQTIQDKIICIRDGYKAHYLEGSLIVVAATDDQQLNTQIALDCKKQGVLCNVVSDHKLSSFMMPSFIKRGDLVISVSTAGKSPALGKKIKQDLQVQYGKEYEGYIDLLGQIRECILKQTLSHIQKEHLLTGLLTKSIDELREYLKDIEIQ